MDERLVKQCKDPINFDKIRYLVHSLDTDKMYQVILEICQVNPYLAVLCYNTSEQNNSFKNIIMNAMDHMSIGSLHMAILLCLAWDSLIPVDSKLSPFGFRNVKRNKLSSFSFMDIRKRSHRIIRIIVSTKEKCFNKNDALRNINLDEWNKESLFWIDKMAKCVLRNTPERIYTLCKVLNNTSFSIDDYMEDIVTVATFPRNADGRGIKRWLSFVWRNNFCEKLNELGFSFESDYGFLTDRFFSTEINNREAEEMIEFSLWGNEFKKIETESILPIVLRLLSEFVDNRGFKISVKTEKRLMEFFAIGLLQGKITLEQIKENAESMPRDEKKRFNLLMKWYNVFLGHGKLKKISPIYDHELFNYSEVWWRCSCGFFWKDSINKTRIICPSCGLKGVYRPRKRGKRNG